MFQAFKTRLPALCSCVLLSLTLIGCGGSPTPSITRTHASANQGYSTDDLYRFFAVAFGAAPGVTYMGQLIEAAEWGLSIKEIVNIFTTKSQFTDTYPLSMSNVDFATKLVNNVVGNSAPEEARQRAVNDIVDALTTLGWSRGDIVYTIFNNLANKQSSDTDWYGTAQKMAKQVVVATYFTEVMRQDSTDLALLRNVIAYVDENTDTTGDLQASVRAFLSPAFAALPTLLPDVIAKYNSLCGTQLNMQSAVAANLSGHKDGKKDLVFTLWCAMPAGAQTTAPTLNGLLAFVQNTDGSFRDATQEIFGVGLLDIGGVGFVSAARDFNGDGYDEVFIAVTGEDGRSLAPDYTGNNRQNVIITSGPGGKYSVLRLGTPSYNYTLQLVPNPFGGQDVLTSTIGYGGQNLAYRYTSNGWSLVTDYDGVSSFSASFYNDQDIRLAVNSAIAPSGSAGLALFKKSGVAWSLSDRWTFDGIRTASYKSWNGDMGNMPLVSVNGKDYGFISFSDNCLIRPYPTGKLLSLFAVPAQRVTGGYDGRVLVESSSDFIWNLMLLGFTENQGKLSRVDVSLKNEVADQKFFGLKCGDINQDGYEDIYVNNWGFGAKPLLYLNDLKGGFALVDQQRLPPSPIDYTGSMALYEDLDGDGIKDMLYFPALGFRSFAKSAQFRFYRGLRNLNATDLKS